MNELWAKRLVAGTKTWEDVPPSRRCDVEDILEAKAEAGEISRETVSAIIGLEY